VLRWVAIVLFRLPSGPVPEHVPEGEIAGVYAGVRKRTAFHDQLFAICCQWVLMGFHRFFAGFFGICPIWGTKWPILLDSRECSPGDRLNGTSCRVVWGEEEAKGLTPIGIDGTDLKGDLRVGWGRAATESVSGVADRGGDKANAGILRCAQNDKQQQRQQAKANTEILTLRVRMTLRSNAGILRLRLRMTGSASRAEHNND
jgi:hypothetical protein